MTIEQRARELLGDVIGYDLRRSLDTDSMTVTIDDALTAISAALSARASAGENLSLVVARMLTFENSEYVPNIMFDQLRVALKQFTASPQPAQAGACGGWLLDGNLIYQLSDERPPQNTHEIKVTQWNGSRNMKDCDAAARELYRTIAAAPQPQDHIPDADKIMVTPPAHGNGEAQAWMHEGDASRVISARQKAQAIKDGGASASSVAPYTIPLTTRPTPEAQEDTKRLDFLLDNCAVVKTSDGHHWRVEYEWLPEGTEGPFAATKRAAIDAALALPAQGEGNNG